MLTKVEAFIEKQNMLPEHAAVYAAVSGGADSVALLSVLTALSTGHDWHIRALHVNHEIRGAEADKDEAFVKTLCEKSGVGLRVIREDVPAYAKEHKLSLEEAGRILRYKALDEAAEDWENEEQMPHGTVRIALAHHADDNAETIIYNLLRGSGLRGLSGIRPVSGRRIRPLLCVSREEIRTYLSENGIEWREDLSNEDLSYTRNRIRKQILPLMETTVNPRSRENIVNAGLKIAEADEYLLEQAEEIFARYGWREERAAGVSLNAFREQKSIIRSYILRLMLDAAAPGRRDVTSGHYDMIDALAFGKVGSSVNLPDGLKAGRDYDSLWIRFMGDCAGTFDEVPGAFEGEYVWEPTVEGGRAGEIRFTVFPWENNTEITKNKYTKWFDYDKISGALSLRTRKNGDFITLAGGGRKSLKRFFIDEKIPKERRDSIMLLAEGNHILWIIGYRISEFYKITNETKRILQAEKTEE